MARSLASRLDRLERLAEEVLNQQLGSVYLREGTAVPEGVTVDRVIYIKRVFIDPPEQAAEELPEIVEPCPRASPQSFNRPLTNSTNSPLGIV
jgi:hypothetical protein